MIQDNKDFVSTVNEGVLDQRKPLLFDLKDEDLLVAINDANESAGTLYSLVVEKGKVNKLFWKRGTDIDPQDLNPNKANVIDNRIFMSLETIIPMVTATLAEPKILGVSLPQQRELLQQYLRTKYEIEDDMGSILQKTIRHEALYYIGVAKYRWDLDQDRMVTETVHPWRVKFDPTSTHLFNCEYILHMITDKTLGDLVKEFPSKKKELLGKYGENEGIKVVYTEVWGGFGAWVAWKIDNILLGKKKNPNFIEEEGMEDMNLFKKPQFPFIIYTNFDLEECIYDDTTLVEQAIPLQRGVNKLENQMLDLNEGKKRTWLIPSSAMTEETFEQFIEEVGDLGVFLDGDEGSNGITIPVSGEPGASIPNQRTHLIGEIDNIMGTHATTRGERTGAETLGGKQLMIQADYGRQDMVVRNLEQFMEVWYNAVLHMTKIFAFTDQDTYEIEGEDGLIQLNKDDIPASAKVMVKKGSSLPTDKRSRMGLADKLVGAGMIDPESLFKDMGYGDYKERSKALYDWLIRTGKVKPEIAEDQTAEDPRVSKVMQIINSPEFAKLPPEEQQAKVAEAKSILVAIREEQNAQGNGEQA